LHCDFFVPGVSTHAVLTYLLTSLVYLLTDFIIDLP